MSGHEASNEPLRAFADGVWLASEPISIVGMPLATTMTVLRLRGGDLLVHSPISLTPVLRDAVAALGPVVHLYAPNTFHHLYIGEWLQAFPEARLHAPSGLARKRPELRIDRKHDCEREPAFEGQIDEVPIRGFRLEETALFHRPASLLVLADLVHNVGRPDHAWARLYTKLMGFHDRVALSRMLRWLSISDRSATRESIDELLALPFDKIVVGHGAPIVDDAKRMLEQALSWLPPGRC